jgi:histidinol phosphatase-like enzyme
MYLRAVRELGVRLQGSYFVGDREKDVAPAEELGGQGILVRTGYGREEEARVGEEVWVVDSLLEAARRIRAGE